MAESTWGQSLDNINPSQGGGEFEIIPEGKYDFVIQSTKVGTTRKGDKEKVGLLCRITSGPQAGKKQYNDGTFTWSVDDEDSMARLLGNLAVLGIDKEWIKTNTTPENLADTLGQVLKGRTFSCDLSVREWPQGSGNTRMSFGFIEKYQGPPLDGQPEAPAQQQAPAPTPPAPQATPTPPAPPSNAEAPF